MSELADRPKTKTTSRMTARLNKLLNILKCQRLFMQHCHHDQRLVRGQLSAGAANGMLLSSLPTMLPSLSFHSVACVP
eukprot:6461726-Amphidinium_carterae.1